MTKGIIFYTDCRIGDPIKSVVQEQILKAGLPVVSCSLEPLDFGKNITLPLVRGYLTYIVQILTALENSTADYVFFCEHDVLYPQSHFQFTPSCDSIFYYNEHVWRWLFGSDKVITYDRLLSLSGLCVNRKFALEHYLKRWEAILQVGLDKFSSAEPDLARKWGYEPGAKKKRRGGFSDDDFATWRSAEPIIDIRHNKTFSSPKVTLDSFKHQPENWQEMPIEKVAGWDLKNLFSL